MVKKQNILSLMLLFLIISGCSSVNIRTDDATETKQDPNYQQRFTYWWWGLKGEHSVNVREVCLNQPVEQLQAVNTLTDTLLAIVTIGIYAPRTARVWCKPAASTENRTNNLTKNKGEAK